MVTVWCSKNCLFNSRIFSLWEFVHTDPVFWKTYRNCTWSNLHKIGNLHGLKYHNIHLKYLESAIRRNFKSFDCKGKDKTWTFKTVTKMGIHNPKCYIGAYLYKMERVKSIVTHYLNYGQLYLIFWPWSFVKFVPTSLSHSIRYCCKRH